MRKFMALAAGLAAAFAFSAPSSAAVKSYYDMAAGKWVKYDTNGFIERGTGSGGTGYSGNYTRIPKKMVDYDGPFMPNTIVVNTAERRLYLILPDGKAWKYGIGVGREGFTWQGTDYISAKAEWPGWRPPPEMIKREKAKGRILPTYMEGGIRNPLGARALYIGGTIYRIHGSNEPWSIGRAVSSGCIRLTNDDVTDLYERVKVGYRVVVLSGDESPARLAALAKPPPPKKKTPTESPVKDDLVAPSSIPAGQLEAKSDDGNVCGRGRCLPGSTSDETTATVAPVETPAPAESAPAKVDGQEAAALPDQTAAN